MNKSLLHLFVLLGALLTLTFAKDATLEEKAIGKDVAETVLRKISRSKIFPDDHSFLIRLTYVESHFGNDSHTFRANYFGGLWQVDEKYFNQSKSTTLAPQHTAIQSQFNINWTTTTWRDLLKPLHSGLAAALYFNQTKVPTPDTIVAQATYWQRYYREEGNVTVFKNESEELRNQTKCRGKMDLCIVLDGSGSIGARDFLLAKNFVGSMIESFSLDFTRIGMQVYSTTPSVIFEINNNSTIEELARLARSTSYPGGSTSTDLALLLGIQMFNRSNAINESSSGVPKIMTVLTDGNANYRPDLKLAVDKVANASIKTVAIGIGSGIDQVELLLIAQNDTQSVFSLDNFSGLQDFIQKITAVTCETPQEPIVNQTQNDSLVQNEKRIYKIKLPAIGITIRIEVKTGKTIGYWSRTEPVPTAALHDGIINGPTFIPGSSARQSEQESSVYFTIQGLEQTNNYTLTTEEGNKAGGGGGGGGGGNNGSNLMLPFANCLFILICINCMSKYFV